MENVSEGHIASDDHRLIFAKIKEKLANAEDFEGELRALYKVQGFDEFALSLMWIAELLEIDPTRLEYDIEEQGWVVDRFRHAVGDTAPAPLDDLPTPEIFPETAQEVAPEGIWEQEASDAAQEPVQEETPEMPTHLLMETAGHIDASEQSVYAPPSNVDESEFGPLLEQFVEAMQSGSENREGLLSQVLVQANAIAAPGSGASEELAEFSLYLIEFLNYITGSEYLDDVRVMNILSNVSGPVASWSQAAPDGRSGLLAEAVEMLRSFKSLFE
jgi:predicted HTH domain antitoxin